MRNNKSAAQIKGNRRKLKINRFVVDSWEGLNNTLLYLEQLVSCNEYELLYHMLHGAKYDYQYLMWCKQCYRWYLCNSRNAVYCSDQCRWDSRPAKKKVEGICPECGEEFTGRADKRFCSDECRNRCSSRNYARRKAKS
jgi:hypothetical protein